MKTEAIVIKDTGHLINKKDVEAKIKAHLQEDQNNAGQFNEYEQIEGFDSIKEIFEDANAAWYWLTVPNDALGGAEPLDLLRDGEVDRVVNAAEGYLQGDFG